MAEKQDETPHKGPNDKQEDTADSLAPADDAYDPFIRNWKYPNPSAIFSFSPASLESIKDRCCVVIDTNQLLLPYTVSNQSLQEIRRVIEKLKKTNRLFVPEQVAREFADLRASKIAEVIHAWDELHSRINAAITLKEPTHYYPLLEELPEYADFRKQWGDIKKQFDACKKSIDEAKKTVKKVLDKIQAWHLDDPVSSLYRSVLTPDLIVSLIATADELRADYKWRLIHRLPPGFNDAKKPDKGIGDFLIWKAILQLGKEKGCPVLFVTGEEKNDWVTKTGKYIVSPRYELIDEFRRESNGQTFSIVTLADLLDVFGASADAVKELRVADQIKADDPVCHPPRPMIDRLVWHQLKERFPQGKLTLPRRSVPYDYLVSDPSFGQIGVIIKYLPLITPSDLDEIAQVLEFSARHIPQDSYIVWLVTKEFNANIAAIVAKHLFISGVSVAITVDSSHFIDGTPQIELGETYWVRDEFFSTGTGTI